MIRGEWVAPSELPPRALNTAGEYCDMKTVATLLQQQRTIRVIGFDDAPFDQKRGSPVALAGVVCGNTRFEGMLWGFVERDGIDATDKIIHLVKESKFYQQLHLILTDGIAVGGLNMIDISMLSRSLDRPCIAVMRRQPNTTAFTDALSIFTDADQRLAILKAAGVIYQSGFFHYQVSGIDPEVAGSVLHRLSDKGHVPEALGLAQLIGAAVITGQSSNRA